MKTKMNEMNKKAIKFINSIALTLVLSMTVFVACQKEAGIGPNNTPAANSGLANKEVALNPGIHIYDLAAGDPLFAAYYEAYNQLKAPLFNKMREGSMDKHLDLLEAALANDDLEQASALMGYDNLDCYMASVANLQAASSELLKKYPLISPENPGAVEKVTTSYFEKHNNEHSMLKDINLCGSLCSKGQVPDQKCCDEAMATLRDIVAGCVASAVSVALGCSWLALAPPAYATCLGGVLLAELACISGANAVAISRALNCCKEGKH